jgi:hypothetical protein
VQVGQIYDSCVQMGVEGTSTILKSLPTWSGDLSRFLDARTTRLLSMGDVFAKTITRIRSYRHVYENNNEWISSIKGLNNDGDELVLHCNDSFTVPMQIKALLSPPNRPEISSAFSAYFSYWFLLL